MRQSAVAAGLEHVCILQAQHLTRLGDDIFFRRIRHVGHVNDGDGLMMKGKGGEGRGVDRERIE